MGRPALIGFLGIGANHPRRFDEQDADTLALFARNVAIAIENARLFANERQRTARSVILNKIARLVTRSLDVDAILQTALEAINTDLNYPSVAVLLVDDDDPDTLVLRVRSGDYARHVASEYRPHISHGVIGAAARARRYVLVEDVRRDPRYIPFPNATHIRCELAAPIVAGDRLLGALNIASERAIDDNEAHDLQIVADQLGSTGHRD